MASASTELPPLQTQQQQQRSHSQLLQHKAQPKQTKLSKQQKQQRLQQNASSDAGVATVDLTGSGTEEERPPSEGDPSDETAKRESPSRPFTMRSFKSKLRHFERAIRTLTLKDEGLSLEERKQHLTETLGLENFCKSIRGVFGPDIRRRDLNALFCRLLTNPDADIDWSEAFGLLYRESGAEAKLENELGEDTKNIFCTYKRERLKDAAACASRRRDYIQMINDVKSVNWMGSQITDLFLTASLKGHLCVFDGKHQLQSKITMSQESGSWVTGVDFLPRLRRVVATTERSVVLWDAKPLGRKQHVLLIKPLEHTPRSLCRTPPISTANSKSTFEEDAFLIGDDHGGVTMIQITLQDLQNQADLLDKTSAGGVSTSTLLVQCLDRPIHRRQVHTDWVLKIKYYAKLRSFASCSASATQSFVLDDPLRICDHSSDIKGVSIPKGCNTFAYCESANVLATGGADKVIRLWHPHIFSRPSGQLIGHMFTIMDLTFNEKEAHLISLSTTRVFRVWDLQTLTSLQIFNDSKMGPTSQSVTCMTFDNRNDQLLTGSATLEAWPLMKTVQDSAANPQSHERPIVQVLCVVKLNIVITVCTGSVLKAWELDTGTFIYAIPNPHGPQAEVTAMAIHPGGFRLATGALDGSVSVWDSSSGQPIRTLGANKLTTNRADAFEDQSVVGLAFCGALTPETRHKEEEEEEEQPIDAASGGKKEKGVAWKDVGKADEKESKAWTGNHWIGLGWNDTLRIIKDMDGAQSLEILCSIYNVYRTNLPFLLAPVSRGAAPGLPRVTRPVARHERNVVDAASRGRVGGMPPTLDSPSEATVMSVEPHDNFVATGYSTGVVVVTQVFSVEKQTIRAIMCHEAEFRAKVTSLEWIRWETRYSDLLLPKVFDENEEDENKEPEISWKVGKNNIAQGGTAAASSSHGDFTAKNAFRGPFGFWHSLGVMPQWISYEFKEPKLVCMITLKSRLDNKMGYVPLDGPTVYSFQGSNSSSDPRVWEDLVVVASSGPWTENEMRTHYVAKPKFFKCYRLYIKSTPGRAPKNGIVFKYVIIRDFRMYTIDESEMETFVKDHLQDAEAEEERRTPTPPPSPSIEVDDPLLCAGYKDSRIRFWSMKAKLLLEVAISMPSQLPEGSITALEHIRSEDLLMIADSRGYISTWRLTDLLSRVLPAAEGLSTPPPMPSVFWRGHLAPIVKLRYVAASMTVMSASLDGSVRLFHGRTGHFLGYFGQYSPFSRPKTAQILKILESDVAPLLPSDIQEPPFINGKVDRGSSKKKRKRSLTAPLVLDESRWSELSESQSDILDSARSEITDFSDVSLLTGTSYASSKSSKYFQALVKPQVSLQSLKRLPSHVNPRDKSAVFRALPVYRILDPETQVTGSNGKVMTRHSMSQSEDEDLYTSLFGGGKHRYQKTTNEH